jgi:hypothetical protein
MVSISTFDTIHAPLDRPPQPPQSHHHLRRHRLDPHAVDVAAPADHGAADCRRGAGDAGVEGEQRGRVLGCVEEEERTPHDRVSTPLARTSRLARARLRIRSAVLRPLRAVGSDPFLGARDPALDIAHSALQAVTQHVKATAMPAGARGIGHGVSFDGDGGAVCAWRAPLRARHRTDVAAHARATGKTGPSAACLKPQRGIAICLRTYGDPKVGATKHRSLAANYLVFFGVCRRACAKSEAATVLTAGDFDVRSNLLAVDAAVLPVCLLLVAISCLSGLLTMGR